ncbi:MAG: hypothetical protein FWC64_11305 [Treponema sp.]|nr:hypothetical protein [Treponema sp.]
MENIKYVEINGYNQKNAIKFKSIEDFEYFVSDNQIKTIFYGARCITEDYYAEKRYINCFFAIFESFICLFEYKLEEGYYKTIQDYKDGKSKGFTSGEDYYFSIQNGLKDQEAVNYYKKTYFLSGKDYRDALKHGFIQNKLVKEHGYLMPIMGLIKKKALENNIH